MHRLHDHQEERLDTKGLVINWSKPYDIFFSSILRFSESRILELAKIKPGDAVLDVGCGPGSLSLRAKKLVGTTGSVAGIDASAKMIELAQRKAAKSGLEVNFQNALIEALPFPDNSFDVVMSRLVIHHLPGDLKLRGFAEMKRVLKPGGICLAVDFDSSNSHLYGGIMKPFLSKMPMSKIDVKGYAPLFEKAGFSAVEYGPTGKRLLSFVRGSATD